MAPSPSAKPGPTEQAKMLGLARRSIHAGLLTGRPGELAASDAIGILAEPHGCFVTLTSGGRLRGCIGTVETSLPLAHAVSECAFGAAFRDTRFRPLSAPELPRIRIEISVLTTPIQLAVSSEAELLTKLRPHVDGLILDEDGCRATFLPAVWETLKSAGTFVRELKVKAGLPRDYWSDSIRAFHYEAISFGEDQKAVAAETQS